MKLLWSEAKEDHRVRDLLGTAHASERNLAGEKALQLVGLLLVGSQAGDAGGVDQPGGDRVEADAAALDHPAALTAHRLEQAVQVCRD